MIHFPSTLHNSNILPTRSDSLQLNATQLKAPTHKIFLTIEEELHDARRVHSHGQEEDLRLALNMLIERLSQVSTMLSDAYKTSADLEVQLNVTKSNLALITANNEMLEDALKQRDATTQNVGWRRTSGRAHSTDDLQISGGERTPTSAVDRAPTFAADRTPTSAVEFPAAQESHRFFKFRFTQGSSSTSSSSSRDTSRPGTPGASPALSAPSLNSPSMPALGTVGAKDREMQLEKELEKEKKACEDAKKAKKALEAEIENLSQALFEEANRMVATERIRLADVEEELREAKLEKDALRSALRLLEGQASASSSATSSAYASASASPTPSTSTSTDAVPVPASFSSSSTSASPLSEHIPPSLSITGTARPPSLSSTTTIRASLPPPAPVEVPTTPFDYNAVYVDTPTPRAQVDVPLADSDVEENVKSAPAYESASESETKLAAGEDSRVLDVKEEQSQVSTKVRGIESSVEPAEDEDLKDQAPPRSDAASQQAEEKRRPPELDILSRAHPRVGILGLEHESDPWADAQSASASRGLVGESV